MTSIRPEELFAAPKALAPHYSRFGVTERVLLTGHSHQAWPDVGFEAQGRAWLDAAELVDDKWERAFEKAARCRRGWRRLLTADNDHDHDHDKDKDKEVDGSGDTADSGSGYIALAGNTHELVVRFLSALPLAERPRIVTTDGEFHTVRRQLDRLEEEGLEVVRVPHVPADGVAEALAAAADDRTACAIVSAVFYTNAHIVPGLGRVMEACQRVGAELLVDAYHALNAVPFSLRGEGLERAFVVGGGYKYCQLGEGNCFLRFPREPELRPVVTGWYSEFEALTDPKQRKVVYGAGPHRFAGATYDPSSHYRAAAVFDFFEEMGLTPELLREVSQHQVGRLASEFDALDLDPAVIARDRETPLEKIGGFLALRTPHAAQMKARLRERGVFADYRGEVLRLGPAPYLSDQQIGQGVAELGSVARTLNG